MVKKDYLEGTYCEGKFRPYEKFGEYNARLDFGSSIEARSHAEQGEIIHGTYKNGIFRPADLKGKEGYASVAISPQGKVFRISHTGEFYDSYGNPIGRLDERGRPEYYRTSQRVHNPQYNREVDFNENEVFRDIIKSNGRRIRVYTNEELTNLAEYISRSNKILGKFRKSQKNYNPKTGIKIKVYETEIPEFSRDSNRNAIFGGFNAKTEDEKEHLVVIDKRLKPYEKIAVLVHELSHVYGGAEPSFKEEHDAHLAAINQLSKLYEDYDVLRKAITDSENPFFDVKKLPKRDLGQAVAYLVGTRKHFGVRAEELRGNESTFRKIRQDLEGRLEMIIIPVIALSLLSFSPNITGNSIANLSIDTTSYISLVLFFIALITGFFCYKSKKSVLLFTNPNLKNFCISKR